MIIMGFLIFLMFLGMFLIGASLAVVGVHQRNQTKAVTDRRHQELRASAILPVVPSPSEATKAEAQLQGTRDMIRAWLDFNAPPHWDHHPNMTTLEQLTKHLADIPPMDAGKHVLIGYMDNSRTGAEMATKYHKQTDLVNAMRQVAARIYLLTDGEFQSAKGASSGLYLSHDDPAVVDAYVRGQLEGVEKIKQDIIVARDRARAYKSRRLGIAENARTHDANIAALRETARWPENESEVWEAHFRGEK